MIWSLLAFPASFLPLESINPTSYQTPTICYFRPLCITILPSAVPVLACRNHAFNFLKNLLQKHIIGKLENIKIRQNAHSPTIQSNYYLYVDVYTSFQTILFTRIRF